MNDREDQSPSQKHVSRGEFLSRAAQAAGGAALASTIAPSVLVARAAPAEAQPVTLRLQNWFSQTDLSAWQVGLDMVKKANPNIEVKLEYVDYNSTAVK